MANNPAQGYSELHCLSNFTFLRGASHARELVQQAKQLQYRALAITDECSLAGIVRAWEASKEVGLPLICGAELQLDGGPKLVLLAPTLSAYQQLCRLITRGRRQDRKGRYRLSVEDLDGQCGELLAMLCPRWPAQGCDTATIERELRCVREHFQGRLWLAFERFLHVQDLARLEGLQRLGQRYGVPLVAAGDVHCHVRTRQPLQDVMTCIRTGHCVDDEDAPLLPNGERHLRPLATLARLYPPSLLRETVAIADRCGFDLGQLRYQYPNEVVPAGETATSQLRRLTEEGALRRWPTGCPASVRATIEKELALIAELGYEPYFLTVADIVSFARQRGILVQGRGSSANSAVCFALGITEVDPAHTRLLFERFISRERAEPPDIDLDIEHQLREEVFRYIYAKYGRDRAALTATVICYRRKSAVRDVAKALGLPGDLVGALSRSLAYWDDDSRLQEQLQRQGLALDGKLAQQLLQLVNEIEDMPRHLSQHVGGFVISDPPLSALVPIENAVMPGRTILQWDKDDLDALGILKIDCLALGMLSALRRALQLASAFRGKAMALATIPAGDAATYDMLCRGGSMGVFQVESRAQMSLLPRLKPRHFADLVIEVALIRPGPLQGNMVHPYLRRREGAEPVDYPSEALREVLGPTLGIPLFQEQVMELAVVAAGFSPGEADQVRRSMAAWKRKGGLEKFRDKLLAGMHERGYSDEFAENVYQQILGFGSYGFPQSHAASFALLTYASSWLKRHEPEAFYAGLLNSMPMGFYQPMQLVNDARRHQVVFRPVDVTCSEWDCTLERSDRGTPEVRLGLRMVSGLAEVDAQLLCSERRRYPFSSIEDLANRTGLNRRALNHLANAGAFQSFAGHRHAARWATAGVQKLRDVLTGSTLGEDPLALPAPTEGADLLADLHSTGVSLGRHPLALLRKRLRREGALTAQQLLSSKDGRQVKVAGVVTHRQRPATASGVLFVTLEDETGLANLIVWPKVLEEQRTELLGASLLVVEGRLQLANGVAHVITARAHDRSAWLGHLRLDSRDFH